MDCPKCKSSRHRRDGIVGERQRYKCKDCNFRFTVERKSDVKTPDIKRLVYEMYLEGIGFRSIGRILRISYGTVYVWIKKWSLTMPIPRRERQTGKVELESLTACVESKKNIVHYGLLLIDLRENVSFLSLSEPSADKTQE